MKKACYIFIIIAAVFFSCNSEKQGSIAFNIVKIDSLSIYFPDTIPMKDVPRSWNYHDSVFSYLMDNQNSIIFYEYNIYTGKWHVLAMQKEGNNGLLNSGQYETLKTGKLIYFPKYTNKIFLIDPETGEILKTFTISGDLGVYHSKNFNIRLQGNELIMPVFSKRRVDREYFQNNKLFAVFQMGSQDLQSIVNYPEDYLELHAPASANIGSEFFFRGDSIIYCFPRDKHVYVFDLSSYKTTKLKLENPHLQFSGAILNENPYTVAVKRELEGKYSLLLNDTVSGLIYRISVYYPRYKNKLPRDQEELSRMFQSRKINIMTLNNSFEVIANSDLEGITDALFFINENGLYMRSMFETENEYRFIRLGMRKKKESER
ncbi:MAG: hypothetical protein U5Q03_05735 [Bacteroidota bacterium]|nr:hypothetical protein [Bacteroidota bacterium]